MSRDSAPDADSGGDAGANGDTDTPTDVDGAGADDRPNILLIHCHDLGRHLGCYGRGVRTPDVDALAADGVRFSNYFATAAQCSPSRGSMMTGLHPHRNGLVGLVHLGWEIDDGVATLPALLRDAGYGTYLFGEQHEASDPAALGYDRVHDDTSRALAVAERVEEDLSTLASAEPFFASVGFFEPHREYRQDDIPEAAYDRYDPEEVDPLPYLPDRPGIRRDLADLNAMITATTDVAVGRIREALEREGLDGNTVTVFTADHGIAFPRAKGTCYDPGLEAPLLVRYPGEFPEGAVRDELLSNVDLLPTLLDLAGAPAPDRVAGRSFLPLLRGEPAAFDPRGRIYAEMTWHDRYNPMRCVRTERYKYVRSFGPLPRVYLPTDVLRSDAGREVWETFTVEDRPREELYDLAADPHEQRDLTTETAARDDADHGGALRSLRSDLKDWMRATDDPLLDGRVPHASADLFGR